MGTYDVVDRNEEIKSVAWSYVMTKPPGTVVPQARRGAFPNVEEGDMAWQDETQHKNRRWHFVDKGSLWGQHASLITRIPWAPNGTLLEYWCTIYWAPNTRELNKIYFNVTSPMRLEPVKPPNTFVALTAEIANIQNQSDCWVCMEPPTGSSTGLHLVVLPLTFFEHLSNPVRGLGATTNANYSKRVFAPRDPGVNTYVVPSPLWVENTIGSVCFKGEGSNIMGRSTCKFSLPVPTEWGETVVASNPNQAEEQVTFTVWPALRYTEGMIPPKGIFLVCGNKAYPYLPKGWAGSCFLASVFPDSRIKTTFRQKTPAPRDRRSASESEDPKGWAGVSKRLGFFKGKWWEKAIGVMMPHAGTLMNSIRIDKLSQALEYVANTSMAYYTELSDMLVSMRAMVMQNRVALDMLLAEQGGVCGMIEGECCIWIPDPAEITN